MSQRSSINTTTSRITATTNPTKPTMSFTASSPARVSVTRDVVDDRSMRLVSPWNFIPQPFGLSQSPSSAMATAASFEVADDNLVVVEAPALRHRLLSGCFLTMRRRLSSWARRVLVESEVDEPVQSVHDPWSATRFNALGWGGVDPPVDLDVLHRALIRVDDHQGDHWLRPLIIEDKLDLATTTLNAVQPKIQWLHQDLRQEATVRVL